MYEIKFSPVATKDYKKIQKFDIERINKAIDKLAENPRPAGSKKLSGRNAHRIRNGNFRVIYEIYENELIIIVITIRDRKDVYKK